MSNRISAFLRWLLSLFGSPRLPRLLSAQQLQKLHGWKPRHHTLKTVRDRHLSLWQSAAEEAVTRELGGTPRRADVLHHPFMQAVLEHVTQAELQQPLVASSNPQSVAEHFGHLAYASSLFFQSSLAKIKGDIAAHHSLRTEIKRRAYEDGDPMFLTVIAIYEAYYAIGFRGPIYRDWKKEGGGNLDYGVIEWEVPVGSKIGILGDWGTGMDDAEKLLLDLLTHEPAAIIHLGDIYYAGTESQARTTFLDVFDRVFTGRKRIPVFNLAGNHDYYARGTGFYLSIDEVNQSLGSAYQQPASYFCLRTTDKAWQFLGADTGVNDHQWSDDIDPSFHGPGLNDSEVEWHKDKLSSDPKNARHTVFLMHHQLFSQHGVGSEFDTKDYLNRKLYNVLSPHFDRISACIWGHEHDFAMYQNGLFGLQRGRLLGCSAYEQPNSSKTPPHVEQVPTQPFKLGVLNGFCNHAYGILQLPTADSADQNLRVSYFQYPSWGADQDQKPPLPLPNPLLTTEEFPSSS